MTIRDEPPQMTPQDSRQIELLRIFCILTMMWVHVSPGVSLPSITNGGEFALVGRLLGDTLGRISVSLLSLVSGYLFWMRARQLSFGTVAWRRFESIMLPCLVWSAIYLVLAAMKLHLAGVPASTFLRSGGTFMDALNAWAGLTGPTANRSLFFLRDLFVATLVLRLAVPLIDRFPWAGLVAALLLGLLGDRLQPLIFRDGIMQFVLLGACIARLGFSMSDLSRPSVGLVFGYLFVLAGGGLASLHAAWATELHLPILLRRLGICLLTLSLTSALVWVLRRESRPRLGRATFLAFLMHVPLIGILWVPWQRFVGSEFALSYLVFYLGTPFVALAAGYVLDHLLDASPPTMQLALRGKVRVRALRRPA